MRKSVYIKCDTTPKPHTATVYNLNDFIDYWRREQFDLLKCVFHKPETNNKKLAKVVKDWIDGQVFGPSWRSQLTNSLLVPHPLDFEIHSKKLRYQLRLTDFVGNNPLLHPEQELYRPLVISFSGGRTSAFMTKYLLDKYRNKRKILVIFANTGKEVEGTLDFVRNCDLYFDFETVWAEAVVMHGVKKGTIAKVVDYDKASRKGEPFEEMMRKYGVPNMSAPHCTRELKQRPINWLAGLMFGAGNFDQALGIRFDEKQRARMTAEKKRAGHFWPLISEEPMGKQQVKDWWLSQKFDLEVPENWGNCDNCYKKSNRKLMTNAKQDPESFEWWQRVGKQYIDCGPVNRTNPFFRGDREAYEIVDDANTTEFVTFVEGEQYKDYTLDDELKCSCN